MDLEAMQLLNLSPIPELSELELSTMLDQLSGLSDVNGDLTDRNVEDILKEAEDLIDRSISSKTHKSKDVNNSQITEKVKPLLNEDVTASDENEDFQQLNLSESKHYNTPVHSDHTFYKNFPDEDHTKKDFNSSLEHTPTKSYSPGSSSNHIRSTIDSLKEFSTLIEKKLGTQSSNSSPTANTELKQNDITLQDKKVMIVDNELKENVIGLKPVSNCSKTGKPSLITKKNTSNPVGKSIKLLNCFERLYQDRPVRLTGDKKPKVLNKSPKTSAKKKLTKSLKKNSSPEKNVSEQREEDIKAKNFTNISYSLHQTGAEEKDSLKQTKKIFSNNGNCLLQMKMTGNEIRDELLKSNLVGNNFPNNGLKYIQSNVEDKLKLKVLKGDTKIKNRTCEVAVFNDNLNVETMKLNLNGTEKPVSSVESEEENFISLSEKNFGIRRLEEQFSSLKEKYDHQMAKLEAENLRLREALSTQQKRFTPFDAPQTLTISEIANIADAEPPFEIKSSKTLILSSLPSCATENKTVQSVVSENSKVPENSPCLSPENDQLSTTVKEAFSQTEKELKSKSIQCSQDCRDIGTNAETVSEARKMENKENFTSKKKLGKSRPFSDVNIHHLRQKRIFDHESQLLATLRGFQAEVSLKEKENRKLKFEIDSLRKQMKKSANCKIESCKKCHIGTQTIGLGSFLQRPYNPENYEVPQEFEKENEELRSRIKALEEDFELLKEKRIHDLQSLHQVHEEEMAKLVSKLETQSALTRHLHSLLINR